MAALRPDDEETLRRFAAWKHRRRTPVRGNADTPSPQEVYAGLMKRSFGPALRDAGLRGSGGRFELPSDVYSAQLGFQKSVHSDGQEVRFTVNLCVILRDEWTQQVAAKPYLGQRPAPTNHYGSWADQARIGSLTPDRADKWWRIVRGVASDAVRDDTLHDLLTYAVPWLRERVA